MTIHVLKTLIFVLLSVLYRKLHKCPCKQRYMTGYLSFSTKSISGATSGTGTAYPSVAPGFSGVRIAPLLV